MPSTSVRYIVNDVDEAIAFYCEHLGFAEQMHPAPTFAMLTRGELRLVLSAPSGQGGGGRAMPDGAVPEPGGWNRFMIEVDDLDSAAAALRAAGVRLRSGIIEGVGGRQLLLDDPSGNPVELFSPTRAEATLGASRTIHTSPDLPAPVGPYSHVAEALGVVWTAGFGPEHPRTGAVPEGVGAQTEQVLDNLEAALRVVGLGLGDVVKVTVHLQHLQRDFAAFNEVYARRLSEPFPVRTTVGSNLLDILVEIDVVAAHPAAPAGS